MSLQWLFKMFTSKQVLCRTDVQLTQTPSSKRGARKSSSRAWHVVILNLIQDIRKHPHAANVAEYDCSQSSPGRRLPSASLWHCWLVLINLIISSKQTADEPFPQPKSFCRRFSKPCFSWFFRHPISAVKNCKHNLVFTRFPCVGCYIYK